MASHFKVGIPEEVERFFDTAEAGHYDEMQAIYKSLRHRRESESGSHEFNSYWRAIVETQGAADQAHDWPAQKLLDASFAMEQSFPFKSTYASATSLGPIMELRVRDELYALTSERAAQSVDYWRTTAQQMLSDSEAADSHTVRLAYAKLAAEQAALLLEHNYIAEAEQAFRLATEIGPTSPEAVFRYINLLIDQNRLPDALPVAENAVGAAPENEQFRNLLEELKRMKRD